MISIQGKGASVGIAVGQLQFLHREEQTVERHTGGDPYREWLRFTAARDQAVEELAALEQQARHEAGSDAARFFEIHQIMARDPDYAQAISELIHSQRLNAEAAVADVAEQFAAMFAAMDDAYLRERSADVKDVSDRILAALTGVERSRPDFDGPVVLAADDLAPSETMQLDKRKILAFVTTGGSGASHTAILARTMGIPAIVAIGDRLRPEYEGREVIVDGGSGILVLDPDEAMRERMLKRQQRQQKKLQDLRQLKALPSVTADGQKVQICCNIGTPADVYPVLENGGEGIGLFRSEVLFLHRSQIPGEDEQFDAYKRVLSAMGGKEVVIRTLDVGADKCPPSMVLPAEANPALGTRGLRLCLNRPDLFRTQLRALYRASAYGTLSIMFPMVTSVWEVKEARKLCRQVTDELRSQGVPFAENVAVGVMIETPSAALVSDRLAKVADFFCLGTNDLTQYTLACDRQDSDLGRFYNSRHPAVLRLVKLVAENARANGIRCSICGELAAETDLTETFLALGIDQFSVAPTAVLPLREKVRSTDVSQVRQRVVDDLMNDAIPL